MSRISKIQNSRSNWKTKATQRSEENRYLRRENTRLKKERDNHKAELKAANQKLKEQESAAKSPAVNSKADLIFLALLLFCVARIGFRAVSRVFKVLGNHLGLKKAPSSQTIINWVARLSIHRIRNVEHFLKSSVSSGYIWMIDTSIALGAGKILTVLAIRVDHYNVNERAPALHDVCCITVNVAVSWTGESIADLLIKLIEVIGAPVAFLKDGGTDLAKAVKILAERGYSIASIDDLSHVIANLLKHQYGKHPMFEVFISACGKVSKKLKQTILACLAPPKVSTKARFMNLHRLVGWAYKLLKLSPNGRAEKGSLTEKLRNSFDRLPECKNFIKQFLRDAAPLLEIQKILKNRGLCKDTAKECEALLNSIPPTSPVRIGMTEWLNNQLATAEKIGSDFAGLRLPITSDSIESLFGVVKTHGASVIKDANRIAGRIPALCGSLTMEDAYGVLNVSVEQQKQAIDSLPSLIKQRREILPNPGNLNEGLSCNSDRHLHMIPGAINRSKNDINDTISNGYGKCSGPLSCQKIEAILAPDIHLSSISEAG